VLGLEVPAEGVRDRDAGEIGREGLVQRARGVEDDLELVLLAEEAARSP
jgi:hypothetical protein